MTGPSVAAGGPVHALSVSGDGIAMYPAFAPSVERYGVTTTTASSGTVVVSATTSDPAGTVWVDGQRRAGGTAEVTGLTPGDEVSVAWEDAGGIEVHSLVYLPAGFPTLSASGPGAPPGHVLLTLSKFNGIDPTFETAVDRNGVPVYVRSTQSSLDLKRLPDGHYSVSRADPDPFVGSPLVELDEQFRPVATFRTAAPLTTTDGHDSVLLPDGGRILMAYQPNTVTTKTDAVVQEVDAQGEVVFTWSSADHVLESDSLSGGNDYAHLNSVQLVDDGADLLLSFRHLSQVIKIARTTHDGFQPGDVVWRLGGRRSDFTFVDPDPRYAGGPCAQHTASQLPDGHILLFDNGSWSLNPYCVDPDDPTGAPVYRNQTRVVEYALDLGTGTATPVWTYEVPGRFALFAGSAERLDDGGTLVGWASERSAVATLVDDAGIALWELTDDAVDPLQRYFTYRAAAATVPDAVPPAVLVTRPADGASYALGEAVTLDVACTDRGGSSLVSCRAGDTRSGDLLATSEAGEHVVTVRGVDGAGNVTSLSRSYRVVAPDPPGAAPAVTPTPVPAPTVAVVPPARRQPDAAVRILPGGSLVGDDVYGSARLQGVRRDLTRAGSSVAAVVRVQNDGNRSDRYVVTGSATANGFRVRYRLDGQDVTRRVTAGSFRTSWLAPGRAVRLRVTVTRTLAATTGDRRSVRVRATSSTVPSRTDAARTVVRAIARP